MSNDFERGIVIVGSGHVCKAIFDQTDNAIFDQTDNVVVVGKEPIPYKAPLPLTQLPQIDIAPYWDGKSARNKRREAERKNKKKRK